VRDDASNPAANGTVVQSLLTNDGVFGLIEETGAASGSATYLAQQKIPVIGLASEPAVWSRYSNMTSTLATITSSDVWGQILKQGGVTRLAILSQSLVAADNVVYTIISASTTPVGITSTNVSVNDGQDPAEIAHRLSVANINGIVSVLDPGITGTIVQDMRAAGDPVAMSLSLVGYNQDLLRKSGPAMAGLTMPVFLRPFEAVDPAMSRFLTAMAEYAPQITDPRQEYALRAYVDADLFSRGLQLAGPCPTRAGFLTAVHSLRAYDADGLVQAIDLRPGANQRTCLALVRVNPAGTAFEPVSTRICGSQ
jgi:branched-chain amino acid transport system substrate-binding protein